MLQESEVGFCGNEVKALLEVLGWNAVKSETESRPGSDTELAVNVGSVLRKGST
jgi:hypothetical protein